MKVLPVPYLSQRNNRIDPSATCNVTSIAMCLMYFGVQSKEQLEDELSRYVDAEGLNRGSPADLKKIVEAYGCKDDFRSTATIEQLKKHIDGGNPAVIHGWFTASGHIVTVVGYTSLGLIVHDPWGEYFESGYETEASGANLRYSWELIRRTCMDDGQFWVHFISKSDRAAKI